MSVRRIVRGVSFRTPWVALAAALSLGGPAAVEAAGKRVELRFDALDLGVEATSRGMEVRLRGAVEAGGEEVPALPMVLKSFYVPEGFEVGEVRGVSRDEVRVAEKVRLPIRERALEPEMSEVSRPFPASALDAKAPMHPSQEAVSLGGAWLAGKRVHTVAVFPVRWEKSSGDLVLSRTIELELELVPASASTALPRLRRTASSERAYDEALRAVVANPEDLPTLSFEDEQGGSAAGGFSPRDLPSVEGSAVDMVIVTKASLVSGFQSLADWKTKKGVPTVIRTVEWIDANYPAGHDQPERVRLFLQDAYSKWGTFIVLIGGDHDDVLPRHAFSRVLQDSGTLVPTDQYFACLDGNWNADGDPYIGEGTVLEEPGDAADLGPDVFIGRAPVSTLTEVSTFVAKSFTYDKTPPAGYVQDHCVFAEVLFDPTWECPDPIELIQLDGKGLAESLDVRVPGGWTRTKLYQSECNEDRQLCLAELNEGHHLLTTMGHGDAFKFSVGNGANPLIRVADAEALSNGNRLHVFLGTACNPNQFDLESIGEALLLNPAGGAIVSIGPTRVDFPNSATDFHQEMYEILFQNGVTRFGAASQLNRVHFLGPAQWETADRWTSLTKELLGDPELRMWTQEPQTLVVTHSGFLSLTSSSITVTVRNSMGASIANALVCISDGHGTYSRGLTATNGTVALPLTSTQAGPVSVVTTRKEFKPRETMFTLTSPGIARLAMTTSTFDDDASGLSNGNDDGVIDAGETIELSATVFNGGGATASSSSLTASIESGTSATFDLLWDGVADPSKVYVGPDRTHPAAIPFTLEFANPAIDYIGAPRIRYAADSTAADSGIFLWQDRMGWHLAWTDGPSGVHVTGTVTTNGRVRGMQRLNVETGDITTVSPSNTLTIDGTTSAADLYDAVDFTLADNTQLAITSSSASLGNVDPSGSVMGTVAFGVASTARREQVGYVDLLFTSSSGGPWSAIVPLVFAGPELEAYVFTVTDTNSPPLSGNGNGVIEVGETVRVRPTVLNRGSGAARSVTGTASASSGITFLDGSDSYDELAPLAQDSGIDGYVFTVNDSTGSSIDLTLVDSLSRTWLKTIDFVRPSAPSGLDFTSNSSSITLTWSPPAAADVAGYNVYRSATSGTGFTRQNFELLRQASRYVDEGLAIGALFYYQVTSVDSSGNESPATSEIDAWTTLEQLPGWPQTANSNVFSSMAIADADSNGTSELYVGSQDFNIYAWDHDADLKPGFPIATAAQVWSTPALADLDEDGDLEMLCGSMDGRLYAVHHDGSPVAPSNLYLVDLAGISAIRSAVTVVDLDGDYDLEIVFGTDIGRVYAFHHDGTGFSNGSGLLFTALPEGASSRIWGPLAVADVDDDGVREIAFASFNDMLYLIEPNGTLEPGFPKVATGGNDPNPTIRNDFQSGVCVGDLDDDGTLEILGGNNNGKLYVFNHDGTGYLNPDGIFATLPDDIKVVPALCNLDGDTELEIVVGCFDSNLYVFNHDGTGFLNPNPLLPFAEMNPPDFIQASPIVFDADGDLDFEIFIGHRNGRFYGFHHDGSTVVGTPIPTGLDFFSTAAAGDMDSDGFVDVAFASYDGSVNVLKLPGAAYDGAYEWPTYGGNNYRTSVYGEITPYVTGVDPIPAGNELRFALLQNRPNPFSSGTSIEYVLPKEMKVTLGIYDISGRLVRTLLRGAESAGARRVVWDGRDEKGRSVAAGVYFYKLEGPEESLTRKSLFLR